MATWRRLQRVGAVQVQGSVYALPATAEAREDLEWIAEEVVGHGGQATLFTAAATEARAHDEIVEMFRRARAKEYEAIHAEAEGLAGRAVGGKRTGVGAANEPARVPTPTRARCSLPDCASDWPRPSPSTTSRPRAATRRRRRSRRSNVNEEDIMATTEIQLDR